jgi:hypothetical protein
LIYINSPSLFRRSLRIENRLETHDLAIPLPISPSNNDQNNTTSTRQLRVLLLSPSSTSTANLPHTLNRINHFAGLTGGQDLIIVFLLCSSTGLDTSKSNPAITVPSANTNQDTIHPTLAFTQLQASLLPRTDIPYIPILPLSNLSNLPELLQKHASALSHRHQQAQTTSNNRPKPLELLERTTAEPPMDRETVYFVTDCFSNLRELAMTCTEPGVDLEGLLGGSDGLEGLRSGGGDGRVAGATERLRELRDLVGWERFKEIVDFWSDEWVIE